MIYLAVQEHVKRYPVVGFILTEIDIPGIENGTQDILDTTGYMVRPGIRDRGIGSLIEGDVLKGLIPTLVDIADELIRLERAGVNVSLIFISYFK